MFISLTWWLLEGRDVYQSDVVVIGRCDVYQFDVVVIGRCDVYQSDVVVIGRT